MGKLRDKIEGPLEKIGNDNLIIILNGEETDEERISSSEKWEKLAKEKNLCFRCLDNSDGKVHTDVTGLSYCLKCGNVQIKEKRVFVMGLYEVTK
jgi:hypothetical protein